MKNCPGCLKEGHDTYCPRCRKRLFGGKKVPHVLSFSRPVYNRAKLSAAGARLSISGVQTKMSLALREGRLEMTEAGGQYILKPIPHGEFRHMDAVPANEHLTMQIAKQVYDINTAENAIIFFKDGSPAYVTKRFDVKPDGTKWGKEDFATLAGKTKDNVAKSSLPHFVPSGLTSNRLVT